MNAIPQTVQLIIASFSPRKWCWNLNKWFQEHLCDVATFEDFRISSMHIHYAPVYCWCERRVLSNYQILPNRIYETEENYNYDYCESKVFKKCIYYFTNKITYILFGAPQWIEKEMQDFYLLEDSYNPNMHIIKLKSKLTNEIMDKDIIKYHTEKKPITIREGVFETWFIEKYYENIKDIANNTLSDSWLIKNWANKIDKLSFYDFTNNALWDPLDTLQINNLQYIETFNLKDVKFRDINFSNVPQNLFWLLKCLKYIISYNFTHTKDNHIYLMCHYYDWIPDNILIKYKEIMVFQVANIKVFSLPLRCINLQWTDEYSCENISLTSSLDYGLINKQDYQKYKQSNPESKYHLIYDYDISNHVFTVYDNDDNIVNGNYDKNKLIENYRGISENVKKLIFEKNDIYLPKHLFHVSMISELSMIFQKE